MRARARLVLLLTGCTGAGAAPLAVTCEPALPTFCANIHVSCSGRTEVPTFGFRLHAQDGRGWIETGAHAVREQYRDARVDRDDDAVILRPRHGAGYIRLLADGRYSFRTTPGTLASCRTATAANAKPREAPMPEVGTKLVFENERVRVWEFTLQPGESIEAHKHEHDYFFYPIEGGTLDVTRASGTTRATLNAGEVYFRKGGDTHAAKNVDDHRYHEVLVELKEIKS